jgi:hypothetical protein
MAEDQPAEMPRPPEGVQRPGVPGAGNILDPAVRAEIREKLHPAIHDAVQKARGEGEPPIEPPAEARQEPRPAEAPPTQRFRVGPYPHGDVDLRNFPANVPPGPVRPNRGRGSRRFYFLNDTLGPKPG